MLHTRSRQFALLLAVLLPCAAYGQIKIGVSVPLTGEGASYGADVKNALEFASQQLGKGSYQLVIEDDKCDGREAATVARKLVDVEHVHYVLGLPCSSAVLASAPIYEKAKTIAISSAATATQISDAGDYIFRTCPSNAAAARVLYGYLAKHHQRFGLISEETEYPQSLVREFFAQPGAEKLIVASESYLPNTPDFRTILLRLRQVQIDTLFVNPQAEPALVRIIAQIKQLNWELPLYGNIYPGSATFLSLAGKNAEGIIFSDFPFFHGAINSTGEKLYEKYERRYGKPQSSDFFFLTNYIAFGALDEAIKSGEDVKSYLYSHRFSNIVDDYSFDGKGDIVGIGMVLKKVVNGKVEPLEEVEMTQR
jgi:branched-chain amino acid transport system substrate-binding protein